MPKQSTKAVSSGLALRADLVELARDFHARGWMAGTAGNLSARDDAEHFWITASGKAKGRLQNDDFLLVNIADAKVVETLASHNRPSAETAIHRALYRLFPDVGACLHIHSVDACLAADTAPKGADALALPPLEMLKGFNIWQQQPQVALPLFDNHLEVDDIAADIGTRFAHTPPPLTALMIRGHGVTVWAKDIDAAYHRVECLEFILSYIARSARA